ncbi:Protocadherin-16 [Taenia crassiceps]|uniref:Protocadherin-16 n=1 Tax=Taenia crassiceps TaxID=6207 RepID=A0ABR4QRF6_9CEST
MLALTLRIILLIPLVCAQRIYEDGQGNFAYDKIELQVYENTTIGSIVLPDLREYLQISPDRQVRLGPGAFSSFFSLTKNYSLLVQSSLDLESGELCRAEESCCRSEDLAKEDTYLLYSHFTPSCRIRAVVLADNGESTPLKPVGRIVAIIQDLNDHAPEFILPKNDANSLVQSIHIPFFEGFKGIGEKFQLPKAKDKDFLPENSMLTYSIAMKKSDLVSFSESTRNEIPVSGGSPAWVGVGPFRLTYKPKEDTLTLEVARELDRESQSEYELALEAEDGDGQRATLIIQVHVLDVNEYEPRFVDVRPIGSTEVSRTPDSSRRVVQVYENATVHLPFIQVIAEDRDAPPANQIAYKFSPSFHLSEAATVFSIDSNTGKISLERPLDFEETKRYVVTVQATDANYEPNAGEMKILPQSLRKVTEAIASSIKKEPKTATLTLEIVVNDCNDHAPEIKLQGTVSSTSGSMKASVDELSVMEDAPPGTSLVFFSATDRDQGEAGVPQCHLLNWTERFRIYNFSDFFSLETTMELDREIQPQYLLTIECFDNGNPRQYSQKQLRVLLLDVNDEAPAFQHPFYSFHILENSPPRTKLTPGSDSYFNPVVAFDKDINSTITYHLEPATTADSDQRNMFDYQLFDVDIESGTLYTKSKLDREQKANHKFNLCADDGIHKACTSIVVHLDDVNDNPPLFDKETYIIRLVENTQFYEPLITFHVTDIDIGNQGFSIVIEAPHLTSNASDIENLTDNLDNFFSIRDNKLFLRQPLDREAKSHYHFFVRVTDLQNSGSSSAQEGLSSTAEVFVEVCDTNDNAPVFIFPNASTANEGGNQLNVSCRETMGSSVGRVVAIDLDLEQNGTVVYSVIQGPVSNELFYLDKQSGELFVNSGRLSENCDSVFLLVISADDMGPPSSKMGRPIPVERLLIRLKDQPTLAEYMSLKSQQPTSTKGRNDPRGDKKYFGLPAKTMLSVVLGGCIVFLAGLFLAWLILTLISRSKRRRRERRERTPCQPVASHCCEARTLLSDGKHEVFVHPTGPFTHGLGPNGNSQFIQCTLGEKDEGLGLRELNTDGSISSRASPYGQGVNLDTNQPLNTGGFIPRISTTNIGSHISRSSPMNFKTATALSAVEQPGWNRVTGANTPGANATANLSEEESNFVVVPGDAVHVPTSACSGGPARYLLFPALSTPSTAIVSIASTSHTDAVTHSFPKPTQSTSADSSSDPRRGSQCVSEENKEKLHQNRAINRSFHSFLTPPPKRKPSKPREADEVLENVHFMYTDNQYTPLAESSTSSQVPCENQYLIITRRGAEMTPVYNTIGRSAPRGSSLPRSLHGCSWSLERVGEKQAVLNHIDEVSGVILVPSMSSPPHSPNSGLNNSVRPALHPKSIHRFEEVNSPAAPATAHLQADYISLEDLFSSCV